MRSSVSVMLSNPAPDTSMSYPDYAAHPNQHHAILLLIKQVGNQIKNRSFHKIFERINRVNQVRVSDSNGQQRPVWVTYKKEYPVDNNDWGDFQTHRRVLGIISIGQVQSQSDLNAVCNEHESLKVKYSSTIYDSRCIILGLNPDGSVYQDPDSPGSPSVCDETGLKISTPESPPFKAVISSSASDRDSGVYETGEKSNGETRSSLLTEASKVLQVNGTGSDSGSESTSELGGEEHYAKSDHCFQNGRRSSQCTTTSESSSESNKISLCPPSSFKTRTLFYPTGDHAVNIESQIHEFIGYLFWVLEYKRMDKAKERLDRTHLLCAPFERKDFVGLDLESRTNKKRCSGRLKKHLADLSLQAGLVAESLTLYSQAADTLKGCNDWLWLAACYEGLCSASALTLYPEMFKRNLLQRYSSLGGTTYSNGSSPSTGDVKNKNIVTSNSLPYGLTPSAVKLSSKFCLTSDDVVEKYKEAIVHYSKYRNAGVIETEASIKAVHVLIEQRQYLLAAEFLNNIVFINLQLSDEEKIVRFNTLSDMYMQIGFHRKAAFFRRVAAMRCIAPQNPLPDWSQCYRLLLKTLPGYKLSLDLSNFVQEGRQGWPALQTQLLHELRGTSQRMGENGLCTRHQAFLLTAMLSHLNNTEREENFALLQSVGQKAPSGCTAMVVPETGCLVPSVSFYNIPLCKAVKVMTPLKERQVEHRENSVVRDSSPFIFSPFQSISASSKSPGQIDFLWVNGDVCEVVLVLENPLNYPIKLTNMMLVTTGSEFESWTSTVEINPGPECHSISLRGRPREPGELRISGYSFNMCGVTSTCRFRSISRLRVPYYSLTVVPSLPCVQILFNHNSSNTIDDDRGDSPQVMCLKLNAGETRECNLLIHNTSNQAVDDIELTLETPLNDLLRSQVFQYSLENLRSQLPINPGCKASLTIYIYAITDFLLPGYVLEGEDHLPATDSDPPSLTSTGPSSVFSRHSNVVSSLIRQRSKRSQSVCSIHSGSSGGRSLTSGQTSSFGANNSLQMHTPSLSGPSCRHIEAVISLSYSGTKGRSLDHWRIAQLSVKIDIVPSLLVTRWDAIPSEFPHQCYVVLDLFNASNHEMDLQYTLGKNILIQAGESCRVPVPVDRCPIAKLQKVEISDAEFQRASRTLGDHVASFIDLQWQLSPVDTPGKAFLNSLSFPPQTHHLITMPPIHWMLKLNGQSIEAGAEVCGKPGQPQVFTVGVTNSSGAQLPPVMLKLAAFQDLQNGFSNYRLEAKMATVGATKVVLPELAPDASHYHECGLMFFTVGVYKIEVSCFPLYSKESGTELKDSSSQLSSLHNTDVSDYQMWKLAPPIELTIEEDSS